MALTATGGSAGGANPSSAAYLAGQQHGSALAIQHHTAAVPARTTQAAAKPAAPNAPATSSAVTLNDLLAQAKGMAAADTQSQVNTIKAQQNTLTSQASDRANQIQLASQAAAQFLSGLGDRTASSYSDAAKTLAGLAQGFTGDLHNTATSAADQVAQNLSTLGNPTGPGQGVIGTVQANVAAQPQALANLLYNSGGFSPASVLETTGQAQAAAQRQLPASTLAYGDQQARGTLGQGAQQAAALVQNILAARASQPKLAQQYLTQLEGLLNTQTLTNSLVGSRAASEAAAQGVTPSGTPLPGFQVNPVTGTVAKVPPGYSINGTGQVVKIPGAPKTAAPKPLSTSDRRNLLKDLTTWTAGTPPKVHYPPGGGAPVPIPHTGSGALPYAQVVQNLMTAYNLTPKQAETYVNAKYQPGQHGRPYPVTPPAGTQPLSPNEVITSNGIVYKLTGGKWVGQTDQAASYPKYNGG